VQYSSAQQAQHIAAAICPVYIRLSPPSASQSDQELANDLLVLLGYLAAGSTEAAAALYEQGFAAVVLQQAAALAGGQQGGLLHQTAVSVATLRVFAPKRDEAACQRLQLLWGVLAGAAVLDSAWRQVGNARASMHNSSCLLSPAMGLVGMPRSACLYCYVCCGRRCKLVLLPICYPCGHSRH
jgi:hypothetical protein